MPHNEEATLQSLNSAGKLIQLNANARSELRSSYLEFDIIQ